MAEPFNTEWVIQKCMERYIFLKRFLYTYIYTNTWQIPVNTKWAIQKCMERSFSS